MEASVTKENVELKQILNILEWMKNDNIYRAKAREAEWAYTVSESMKSVVDDKITKPMAKLTKMVEKKTKELNETIKSNEFKIDFLEPSHLNHEDQQNEGAQTESLGPAEVVSIKEAIARQEQIVMGQSKVILKLTNDIATLIFQVNENMTVVSELVSELRNEIQQLSQVQARSSKQ